jgi:hypothetical protein
MVAHALKGVAGNLFITKVSDSAVKIDSDLKSNRRKPAMSEFGQLRWLLTEAVNAIAEIVRNDESAPTAPKVFDVEIALGLFGDLSSALEELNPDVVEPILIQLAEYLPKSDLMPIQRGVDAFDFDGAKAKTAALAEKLGLNAG